MKEKGQAAGTLTLAEVLATVPVRNRAVRETRKNESETVLYVPMRERWFMGPPLSWLMPISKERGMSLDALGREVWEACDGLKRTEQLIDEFAGKHHLTFHEARVSVLTFLRELTRRGVIVMVKQGDGAEGSGV
jgi:hypothetical protein